MTSRLKMALEELGLDMPEEKQLAEAGGHDELAELLSDEPAAAVEEIVEVSDEMGEVVDALEGLVAFIAQTSPETAKGILVATESMLAATGYDGLLTKNVISAESMGNPAALIQAWQKDLEVAQEGILGKAGNAIANFWTYTETVGKKQADRAEALLSQVKELGSAKPNTKMLSMSEAIASTHVNGTVSATALIGGYTNLLNVQEKMREDIVGALVKFNQAALHAAREAAGMGAHALWLVNLILRVCQFVFYFAGSFLFGFGLGIGITQPVLANMAFAGSIYYNIRSIITGLAANLIAYAYKTLGIEKDPKIEKMVNDFTKAMVAFVENVASHTSKNLPGGCELVSQSDKKNGALLALLETSKAPEGDAPVLTTDEMKKLLTLVIRGGNEFQHTSTIDQKIYSIVEKNTEDAYFGKAFASRRVTEMTARKAADVYRKPAAGLSKLQHASTRGILAYVEASLKHYH
jgi:hypothetical protein